MICVRYDPEKLEIEVRGHARAAEKGRDLICCAVSVLVQALEKTGRGVGTVEARMEPGDAWVRLRPYPLQWMEAAQRYQAVIDGMRMMAESYPAHVRMRSGALEPGTYADKKT